MPNDLQTRPEASVLKVLSEIIIDVHLLIQQQLALFQHELKGEIAQAREAGILVGTGLAIFMTGGVVLSGMLVYLLAQIAPSLPLWGCYGIVGLPITILGAVLCLRGMQKFESCDVAAPEQDPNIKEKSNG